MWIETTNPASKAIKIPEIDEKVEFSETGKAQVTERVGRALVKNVDGIVESGTDEESDEEQEE